MDGLELALPEAVISGSKLMGSRGFGGGGGDVGAAIGKVETVKLSPSHAPDPAFLYEIPDTRPFLPNGQLSSCHGGDTSKDLKQGSVNTSQSPIPGSEAKQFHPRSGKVVKGNSGCSKRSRIVQLAFSVNEYGVEDMKSNSSGVGSSPTKCTIAEKAQMTKQKNNSNVKRSDKRNGRTPKSKSDSFCLKNGLVSFGSVGGGGNFLAAYGSKSDIFDATKPVDEPPLDKLLDGSYERPSMVKEKGKDVQDSNENLLNSVRKACSILRLDSPVPVVTSVEVDISYIHRGAIGTFSTGSSEARRMDGGKADSSTVNEHSSNKDSFWDGKKPAFTTNSPLVAPKDVLERLTLPPSKDLDSLLLDAVKPASSSRNSTELRLGKTASHRNGLPPFSWSLSSYGISKSGNDAVKLSASRTTCPGRWLKVGNTLTSEGCNGSLVDLKSLAYDHTLVPVGNLDSARLGVENVPSKCVDMSSFEQVVLTSGTCSASQAIADDYSARVVAAAETLCKMASSSSTKSSQEVTKSLKRPSQKTVEASKIKLSKKSDILGVAPKASADPDHLFKVPDSIFSSKKIRLSVDEKTDTASHKNHARKEPINWSAPRSIRSSPIKPLNRETVPEMKSYNNSVVKKSFMMPPPTRVSDRAYSSSSRQ